MNDHDSARIELNRMLLSVQRDALDYFGMGKMRARKKLTNGAVVVITITMPPEKEEVGVERCAELEKRQARHG